MLLLAVGTTVLVGIGMAHRRHSRPEPLPSRANRSPQKVLQPAAAHSSSHVAAPSIETDHPRHRRTLAGMGPIAIAVAVLLAGSGVGFVGVSVASQRSAPESPEPTRVPETTAGRQVEGWQSLPAPTEHAPPRVQPTSTPRPSTAPRVLPRSQPTVLRIPAINVESVVHSLGQEEDGTLETPAPGPRYNDAAWYRYSPTPGSLGPSILLGHVDSAAEGPSVFFRLGELTAGDRVAVTRADDSVAVFRVDQVRRYPKDDFPVELVYGDIDHAGLRIVTCGGAFDNASGHYLDNVVVFATLVESPQQ